MKAGLAPLGLRDAQMLELLAGVLWFHEPNLLVWVEFGSLSTKFIHHQLHQRLFTTGSQLILIA